jgi:hypothetical protein
MLVTNPSQQFNQFFLHSADKLIYLNTNCKTDYATTNDAIQNPNMLFLAPVTEEEVLQVSSKLKIKITADFDMIVKQCIQTIEKPLTFTFNLSLSCGIFPNQMKMAKVRPIFTKGQKRPPNCYQYVRWPRLLKLVRILLYTVVS